jgi:sulfite reductase (NADPH) flavoprotein alpha-component
VVLTLRLHRYLGPDGALGFGRVSNELIRGTPLGGLVRGRLQSHETFRPPEDPTRPIVMIAADAGVAPFPGFLDERDASGWAGPAWLIFGNRHRDGDFLWDERFRAALSDGSLTRLDTAFCGDADDGATVQDRLWEQAEELRRWLIDDRALVYICGRREMAREVEATIAAILAESDAPEIDEDRIRIDAFD